ncbi:MAG TPA: asparagine synthase (glutamine-hydrolyzing) [Acidimicrobiales bacterium]|nr:asparagine synthase (glutamine-hydrolyzing) [Acidimicrobiales bacterium]
MCGIAGFLDRSAARPRGMHEILDLMVSTLVHRGPDDSGAWIEPEAGIALGHRRLSIVDLSRHGHQPMHSRSGRYVLDYNGEIYNFLELREQLEARGHRFGGSSDTEVLLGAIDEWGLKGALSRSNGMFALALWDRREHELSLARDRFGEKPMYYGWAGDCLLFASELKAIRAHPAFENEIDRGALALYMRHNCVPAPYSIYRGVQKLPPGTILSIAGSAGPRTLPEPVPYWSFEELVESETRRPFTEPGSDALEELEHLLRDAVGMRMQADVPLGAFLSGGIDSSLVVALMQSQSSREVRTFTIAFDDTQFDEAADAAKVAEHLGTDHLEMLVTPKDALEAVPKMPTIFDEPFSDSSQIPTYLLSVLTREHVKVALSGDGGDELFGGYNRYSWSRRFWDNVRRVPRPLRAAAAKALQKIPPRSWDKAFTVAEPILPSSLRVRMPGNKLTKVADVLPSTDLHEVYVRLCSHFNDPTALVVGSIEPGSWLSRSERWPGVAEPVELMMFLDSMTYLPDDILTKVDRASMAASLEARVPYLDHRVAGLAWRFPLEWKISDGKGKLPLRQILHRYVPEELVERPKMGFGWPVGSWLSGPLREWAEELLDERRLRREGILNADVVSRMWRDQKEGRRDRQYQLWDVLMFQAWFEVNGTRAGG